MPAGFLALALALAPQDPAPLAEGIAASWQGGSLTEEALASWIPASLGPRQEDVRAAIEHLLQIRLVETEAARRGVTASPAEVDARLAEARAAVEAAGLDLDQELKKRGLTAAEFRKLLTDSILHERLARADLGLPPDAAVTPAQLQEWTAARVAQIFEQDEPEPGYALNSGPYRIADLEAGTTLLRTLPPARLREFAGQCALETALPAWGAAAGLVLDDAVLLEELAWRRRRVAENPNYQGATYEDLLAARGSSVEAVLEGGEIRVAGWLRLYAATLWPDSWFDALPAAERAELDAEFGPEREVSWLLLRVPEVKRDELDYSPAEAAAELAGWKAGLKSPAGFAELAERYSNHEESRRRGGRFGFVHRVERGVDPLLCAAAFAAPLGAVSEPLPVTGGMALILVHAERPGPPEPEFRARVRRARQEEARSRFLAELKLRTAWDEEGR